MHAAYHKEGTGHSVDIQQVFTLAGKVANGVCLWLLQMGDHRWPEKRQFHPTGTSIPCSLHVDLWTGTPHKRRCFCVGLTFPSDSSQGPDWRICKVMSSAWSPLAGKSWLYRKWSHTANSRTSEASPSAFAKYHFGRPKSRAGAKKHRPVSESVWLCTLLCEHAL